MPAETSQTLDRGLRVLELLAETSRGLSITELAAAVGVNRTVIYRLVTTLELHNLARRDSGGRVQVGMAAMSLARGVQPMLRDLAIPTLRTLAEDLGATAHLTVAESGEALAIAVVEPSWTDYHVGYRVGARHPLDRGAAGKAILLGRAIVAGERVGRPDFVATHGELQPGAFGVAAPVIGSTGIEASVGVVALNALDATQVGPRVSAAARDIGQRLG
ncbi:MAG: helix-turn-helix domain-containing protein [Propionibacteriales bacterium]|nr:helix-turn-helix domain-containing protein [Propionibacteriales bacterium]